MDYRGSVLPGYVPFLSLAFKLITTMAILLLSGWVVYTIKITRSLHKPQNIFVANLLVSGMILATVECFIGSTMIISSAVSVQCVMTCHAYKFMLFPGIANILSFVSIPVDKVIAIRSPFKHRRIMTPRITTAIVCGEWFIAIIPTVFAFILALDGITDVPEYGACKINGAALMEFLFVYILPVIVSKITVIILNVYLTIRAHQIHKQIVKEIALHGQSEQMTSLKKKQRSIKRHLKPIKTLLVIVLGSTFISVIFPPLFYLGQALVESRDYQEVMEYVIGPNIGFIVRFLYPLVYGLYFEQV